MSTQASFGLRNYAIINNKWVNTMKKIFAIYRTKTAANLTAALVMSSALSCAVAPTSDSEPVAQAKPTQTNTASSGVQAAYANYQKRDFAAAASGFEALANDERSNSESKRLALLGQALVHLSTDADYRNIDQAGSALQLAETMESNSASVETNMLMNALSALIGVEANISELNTKLANSSSEIAGMKQEREELVAEQDALNEALEKLKALTIGN